MTSPPPLTSTLPRLRAMVVRQTLSKQVFVTLRKAIVSGDLRPGTRLKETEIARSLGASRTPVREAFAQLQHVGLARPLKSGGLVVTELSEHDLCEISGLLQVLESYAARLAAERITAHQLDKLDSVCHRAEMIAGQDTERLSELNQQFHELIIEASANQRLQGIIGTLRVALQPYRAMFSPAFRIHSMHEHRQAIELLRVRDAEGLSRLMTSHNDTARQAIVEGIRAQVRRIASTAS